MESCAAWLKASYKWDTERCAGKTSECGVKFSALVVPVVLDYGWTQERQTRQNHGPDQEGQCHEGQGSWACKKWCVYIMLECIRRERECMCVCVPGEYVTCVCTLYVSMTVRSKVCFANVSVSSHLTLSHRILGLKAYYWESNELISLQIWCGKWVLYASGLHILNMIMQRADSLK